MLSRTPPPFGVSAGSTSVSASGSLVFSNSNGVSFGLNGSTLTATVATNYLTTARASTDAIGLNTAQSNVTWTVNSSGISLDARGYAGTGTSATNASVTLNSNGIAISVGAGGGFVAGVSTGGNTSGDTGVTGTRLVLVGNNNVTLSQATDGNGATVTISGATVAGQPVNFSAGTTSGNLGSVVFSNSNLVSFGLNGSTITGSVPALSSLSATGAFSISTNGSTVSMGVGPFSAYAGGNTTGQSSSSALDLRSVSLVASGPRLSVGFSNGSVVLSSPPHVSSYENLPAFLVSQSQTFNGASVSGAVAFFLPQPGSFAFLRIPMLATTNSTTIGTTGGAANASAAWYSSWNAVVYRFNTGASSKSLVSVTSGGASYTQLNSISVAANGTQGSYTQSYVYNVEGNQTTDSTQYSISNTNYSFVTTGFQTNHSSLRYLDINFPASLSAGPYWLVLGYTSSSASGGSAGFGGMTNCNVRYSAHYVATQPNSNWGVPGVANLTSGGLLGGGSFSTAGGGTTSGFPVSAISSSASNPRLYFQMLRSA